jgi:hypothetical protein
VDAIHRTLSEGPVNQAVGSLKKTRVSFRFLMGALYGPVGTTGIVVVLQGTGATAQNEGREGILGVEGTGDAGLEAPAKAVGGSMQGPCNRSRCKGLFKPWKIKCWCIALYALRVGGIMLPLKAVGAASMKSLSLTRTGWPTDLPVGRVVVVDGL